MNIKQIIKESLLNEIGESNAKPYLWKLEATHEELYLYEFVTVGGSNVKITVTFFKIGPKMMIGLVNKDRRLPDDAINLIKDNPNGFWDIEFSISDPKTGAVDEPYATISKSQYKSDLQEFYRILATLNKIVLDFISKEKVRGLTFKPVSKKRGVVFLKYFNTHLPNAQKIITYEGVYIIILDKNTKNVDTGLKKQSYLSRKIYGPDEY